MPRLEEGNRHSSQRQAACVEILMVAGMYLLPPGRKTSLVVCVGVTIPHSAPGWQLSWEGAREGRLHPQGRQQQAGWQLAHLTEQHLTGSRPQQPPS